MNTLYNRVILLAKKKEKSVKSLAEKLGILRQTFNGYLCEQRQNNLWPLLPQILELYPDVSRDWLYFGEGEMLSTSPTAAHMEELKTELDAANAKLDTKDAEIERLRAELERVNRLYQNVSAKLLLGDSTEGCAGKSEKNTG